MRVLLHNELPGGCAVVCSYMSKTCRVERDGARSFRVDSANWMDSFELTVQFFHEILESRNAVSHK